MYASSGVGSQKERRQGEEEEGMGEWEGQEEKERKDMETAG